MHPPTRGAISVKAVFTPMLVTGIHHVMDCQDSLNLMSATTPAPDITVRPNDHCCASIPRSLRTHNAAGIH
jgi:hypothetical protein